MGHAAASSGSREMCRLLVQAKGDLCLGDADGGTALHHAVASEDLCRFLIEARSPVDAADAQGVTCLHVAAGKNCISVCRQLIDQRACLDIEDRFKRTPLHYAVDADAYEPAILLMRNASVPIVQKADIDGNTCLHMAVRRKSAQMCSTLLDERADVHASNQRERSPMHVASLCTP